MKQKLINKILSRDDIQQLHDDEDLDSGIHGFCTSGFELKSVKRKCSFDYNGLQNIKEGRKYKVYIGDPSVFKAKYLFKIYMNLFDELDKTFKISPNKCDSWSSEYTVFTQTINGKKEYLVYKSTRTEFNRRAF